VHLVQWSESSVNVAGPLNVFHKRAQLLIRPLIIWLIKTDIYDFSYSILVVYKL